MSQNPTIQTCCFTGSRPAKLYGYSPDAHEKYVRLTDKLAEHIAYLYQNGVTRFISGAAQGFDQLAFWSVEKARRAIQARTGFCEIQNIVYVPFQGNELRWRETGHFGRQEFYLMLQKADEVRYLKQTPPQDTRTAIRWLDERNRAMVDDSQLLLALFDTTLDFHTVQHSGTANCMRYAESRIPMCIMDVHTLELQITEETRHQIERKV